MSRERRMAPKSGQPSRCSTTCARVTNSGREPRIRDTSRHGVCRPGDEQHGDWSRARLQQMDEKFCKRVERALRDGREHVPNSEMSRTGVSIRQSSSQTLGRLSD